MLAVGQAQCMGKHLVMLSSIDHDINSPAVSLGRLLDLPYALLSVEPSSDATIVHWSAGEETVRLLWQVTKVTQIQVLRLASLQHTQAQSPSIMSCAAGF